MRSRSVVNRSSAVTQLYHVVPIREEAFDFWRKTIGTETPISGNDQQHFMHLQKLSGDFSVCQVSGLSDISFDDFLFLAKTDDELSVVCRTKSVPENTVNREDSWTAFRIAGTLEFSLVGILADIARCLAEAGVAIFAVSTYNTDYILVKKEYWEDAEKALRNAGHTISAEVLP